MNIVYIVCTKKKYERQMRHMIDKQRLIHTTCAMIHQQLLFVKIPKHSYRSTSFVHLCSSSSKRLLYAANSTASDNLGMLIGAS